MIDAHTWVNHVKKEVNTQGPSIKKLDEVLSMIGGQGEITRKIIYNEECDINGYCSYELCQKSNGWTTASVDLTFWYEFQKQI